MKVLFIARRFPPSIGGMQQFAFDLSRNLPSQDIELTQVTWGGSSRLSLPFVLPWLFLKGLWCLLTNRNVQVIHMQDGVLSPLGWLLSKLSGKPWIVVAHGLDLTFKLAFYQKVNVFFARRCSAMIAISEATAAEARKRGIATERITVIPLGVDNRQLPTVDRQQILSTVGIQNNQKVLLTVGRLAKRKGVAWFIANVLPELPKDTHYAVVGEGIERSTIEQATQKHKLQKQVHLLGEVDNQTKEQWLAAADIFVMPNITVPGDMEGFGIVAHEAALAELPIVASNLEGIAQALQDGRNGIFLPEKDVEAYHQKLEELLNSQQKRQALGRQAREYTLEHFGWPAITKRYKTVYKKVIS